VVRGLNYLGTEPNAGDDAGRKLVVMLTLLILLLIVAALFGGFGHSTWGYAGWSPAAILVIILIVLALTGRL